MERKKDDRSFLLLLLLTPITCGIYGIVFFWQMFKDLNAVCRVKEEDNSQNSPNYLIFILLSFVTCGTYTFFWLYKQGNRIQRVGEAYGERIDENGTTLLLWSLLGSLVCGIGAFVGEYLLIKNINKLCRAYNQEYINGGGYGNSNGYNRNYGGSGEYGNDGGFRNNGYRQEPENPRGGSYLEDDGRTVGTQGATREAAGGALLCTRGNLNGARVPIADHEMITIGRDGASCNLVLSDMDISRRHCTVQFVSGENCYYVTDYSSLGVKLNGFETLQKNVPTKCQRGSRILLGNGNNEFLLQ